MLAANNGVAGAAAATWPTSAVGHQPRLGIAGQDNDDDIVQGIVLMRRGEQSMPTIRAVEDGSRAASTAPASCRPACMIETIYDRTDLINVTTRTVLHNMLVGIMLIFLVQWLFLGDLRSAVDRLGHHSLRAVCSPSRF